jgi:hypothetical protein
LCENLYKTLTKSWKRGYPSYRSGTSERISSR